MISTKTQALNGKLRIPFCETQSIYSSLPNEFNRYRDSLQSQVQLLKRRFPNEDSNKIKDLLEQLDNNMEMVVDILTSEQEKNQMICEKPVPKKAQIEQQNKMFKSAITRLYKKLLQQQKDLELLKSSFEKVKKENDDLKFQNRLLLEGEFSNNSFEEERHVF